MEERIPARLTPREGRKFGLTVGAAFLALGGLLAWRGRATGSAVCLALGGALGLAGLLLPARLGPVHRAWTALGQLLSKVTTPIFMGIVYFLVLTSTGWIMRLFGRNPVRRSPQAGSFWVKRPVDSERGNMHHQF